MAATKNTEDQYQKELNNYDNIRLPHMKMDEECQMNRLELLKHMNSNFTCPICLDLLQNTMVTECLHRFCSECITNAIYRSNRECPTCRKKVISKRNLRFDPNMDALIRAIVPNREIYDQMQNEQNQNCLDNIRAFQQNIQECVKEQAMAAKSTRNHKTMLTPIENQNVEPTAAGSMAKPAKSSKMTPPTSAVMATSTPDSGIIFSETSPYAAYEHDFSSSSSDFSNDTHEDDFSSSSESVDMTDDDDDEPYRVRQEDFKEGSSTSGTSSSNNNNDTGLDDFMSPPPQKKLKTTKTSPTFKTMDEFMRLYKKSSQALGIVTVHLKPCAGFGTNNDVYRAKMSHLSTVCDIQQSIEQYEKPNGKAAVPVLFIQTSSNQMIQLAPKETICTVLGLADRKSFLEYPTIYFKK